MFVSYYFHKFLELYNKQKIVSILAVNISSQGLFSVLNLIISFQGPPQSKFKEFSLECLAVGSSFVRKKGKLAEKTTRCHSFSIVAIRYHSLSLIVNRCHSLSLDVPLVVTRCTTRCHPLSLVVIHCTTRCHSSQFVVTSCHLMYHSSLFL